MDQVTEVIAHVIVWCGLGDLTLMIVTAACCFTGWVVLTFLRRAILPDEKWVRYFGLWLLVLALQYGLGGVTEWAEQAAGRIPSTLAWLVAASTWVHHRTDLTLSTVFEVVGSAFNNLLLLATALALFLRPLKRPRWLPAAAGVLVALPVASAIWWDEIAGRFVDAVVSGGCLVGLAWAMYLNFVSSRRKLLAKLNFAGAALYAVLHFAYAFTPAVAAGRWLPGLRNATLRQLEALGRGEPALLPALDAFVSTQFFALKVLLFGAVLILIMRCLLPLSPTAAREVLDPAKHNRGQYLTAAARAVSGTVDADVVTLVIRTPNTSNPRVLVWRWVAGRTASSAGDEEPTILPLPGERESAIGEVLATGVEITALNRRADLRFRAFSNPDDPEAGTVVAVPLLYHGAAIGCLHVAWRRRWSFTATTAQRVRQIADTLAPAAHARRQVAALRSLIKSFRALEQRDLALGDALRLRNEAVHDRLAPVVTLTVLYFGFERQAAAHHAEPGLPEVTQGLVKLLQERKRAEPQSRLSVFRVPLFLPAGHAAAGDGATRAPRAIGFLVLAAHAEHDAVAHPTLIFDPLHRNGVASLLADSLFDLARDRLRATLNDLHVELAVLQGDPLEHCMGAVRRAANDAGLKWVIVERQQGEQHAPLDGEESKRLLADVQAALYNEQAAGDWRWFRLRRAVNGAQQVVRMDLAGSGGRLWLGVARRGFGGELRGPSPWGDFLEGLRDALDAALVRIDRARLLVEANRRQLIATRDAMSGLLLHELKNAANAIGLNATDLHQALVPGMAVDEGIRDKVMALRATAQRYAKLAAQLLRPAEPTRRPAAWAEIGAIGTAIDDALELHEPGLVGLDIAVQRAGDFELVTAVPRDVLSLVLGTLLFNAAEAIRSSGRIEIRAGVEDGVVVCDVSDTGPGIPEEMRTSVFDLGVSTKERGRGWGLPLAQAALQPFGGDLVLKCGEPGRTCFSMRLPRRA